MGLIPIIIFSIRELQHAVLIQTILHVVMQCAVTDLNNFRKEREQIDVNYALKLVMYIF